MSNITINSKANTIEMSKTYAKRASQYGTEEYDALQAVRKDYPRYRIEIKSIAKKVDCFKGLTYSNMENYIKKHNNELLKDFFLLCGKTEDGKEQEFSASASYGEIKKWFIEQFPELNSQRKTINAILGKNKVA